MAPIYLAGTVSNYIILKANMSAFTPKMSVVFNKKNTLNQAHKFRKETIFIFLNLACAQNAATQNRHPELFFPTLISERFSFTFTNDVSG